MKFPELEALLRSTPDVDPDVLSLSLRVLELCEKIDLPPTNVTPLAVPFSPESDEGGTQFEFTRTPQRAIFEVDGGCMMSVWHLSPDGETGPFRVVAQDRDIHFALLNIKGHLIR